MTSGKEEKSRRIFLESVLRDYPKLENSIKNWEEKLMYPDSIYADENIGGGRSSFVSNPTQMLATTLAEDESLMRMKFKKAIIGGLLENTDEATRKIVEGFYFEKMNWYKISQRVNYSESYCRQLRNTFLDELAYLLKLP